MPEYSSNKNNPFTETISRINSSKYSSGLASTTDNRGNVYVLGQFNENLFSGNIFLETSDASYFLAKMDKRGVWRWAIKFIEKDMNDIGKTCNIFYRNNYIYCGGTFHLNNSNTINSNTITGFVLKTDLGGSIQYLTSIEGDINNIFSVSADNKGNAYIINNYYSGLVLSDTIKLGDTTTNTSEKTTTTGYVAKLNTEGSFVWAKDISYIDKNKTKTTILYDIITTRKGHSYVTGSVICDNKINCKTNCGNNKVNNKIILAEIDSRGNLKYSAEYSNGTGTGIDIDDHNNIILTGYFSKCLEMGGKYIKGKNNNLFVAKLDCKWNAEWILSAKYNQTLINVIADKNIYIYGMLYDKIKFGSELLVPTKDNLSYSKFLTKISSNGHWVWAENISDVNINNGKDVSLYNENIYVTGTFNSKLKIINERDYTSLNTCYLGKIVN